MSFTIYDMSAPVFVNALTDMRAWLDKAEGTKSEAELVEARLAPDMRPLTGQFQMASDGAKAAMARLSGLEAPTMADTEVSFDDLRDRCDRTISFIKSIDPARLETAAEREIILKFPNGMGYIFSGQQFLTGFALPNFFFHVTTAYAILRASGIALGKQDFLQHLGAPNLPAGG
jgi:uncharacterized protein